MILGCGAEINRSESGRGVCVASRSKFVRQRLETRGGVVGAIGMPAGRLLEVAPIKQQRVHFRDRKAGREGRTFGRADYP